MKSKEAPLHAPDITFPPDRVHLQNGTTRQVTAKDLARRSLLAQFLQIKGKAERAEWLRKALSRPSTKEAS